MSPSTNITTTESTSATDIAEPEVEPLVAEKTDNSESSEKSTIEVIPKVYENVPESCQEAAQAIQNYHANLQIWDACDTEEQATTCVVICDDLYREASNKVEDLTKRQDADSSHDNESESSSSAVIDFSSLLQSNLKSLRKRHIKLQVRGWSPSSEKEENGASSQSQLGSTIASSVVSGISTFAWSTVRGATYATTSVASGAATGVLTGGIVGGIVGTVQGAAIGMVGGTSIVTKGAVSGLAEVAMGVATSATSSTTTKPATTASSTEEKIETTEHVAADTAVVTEPSEEPSNYDVQFDSGSFDNGSNHETSEDQPVLDLII